MARILLADDDQTMLDLYHHLLSQSEHEVVTCTNALDAMDILYDLTIDLAILDATMPPISGFQLLERLRRSPRFKTLPIAMFTARKEKADVARAIRLGADAYILKPISEGDFMEKVNSLLPKIPLSQNSLLNFQTGDSEASGFLEVPYRILSITEIGIIIASPMHLPEQQTFMFCNPVLKEFAIDRTQLKVISSKAGEDGVIKIRINFLRLTDAQKKQLQEWVKSKNSFSGMSKAG